MGIHLEPGEKLSLEPVHTEPLTSSFKRTLHRWGKIVRGEELTIDDFSKFRGGPFTAARASGKDDKWTVYTHTYSDITPANIVPEAAGAGGPVPIPVVLAENVSARRAAEIILGRATPEELETTKDARNDVNKISAILLKADIQRAKASAPPPSQSSGGFNIG